MEIQTYDFAPGAVFQKGADTTNPAAVAQRLEAIRLQNNRELRPEDVIADASNPKSPLHSFFEWDDSAAAHEHRLKQARSLIRTVVVTYAENPEREPVRTYVSVRPSSVDDSQQRQPSPQNGQANDHKPYYTDVTEALSSPDTKRQVLLKAKADLDSWRRRYQNLKELSLIIDAAERLALDIEVKANEQDPVAA